MTKADSKSGAKPGDTKPNQTGSNTTTVSHDEGKKRKESTSGTDCETGYLDNWKGIEIQWELKDKFIVKHSWYTRFLDQNLPFCILIILTKSDLKKGLLKIVEGTN